jgi:hypothetical protein
MKAPHKCFLGIMIAALLMPMAAVQHAVADADIDNRCTEIAAGYLKGDPAYTIEQVKTLSGCEQDQHGNWFWPTDSYDPRLVTAPISESDRSKVLDVFYRITLQRGEFLSILTRMYDQIDPSSEAQANYLVALDNFTGTGTSIGWGVRPEVVGSPSVKTISAAYEGLMINFATDPNHIDFTNYVTWWIQRRIATTPINIQQTAPRIKDAYIEASGVTRVPWPWELQREFTIYQYLNWALASGLIQPALQPAPTSVN